MFSLFPSQWELPRRKPIKNLADHHFPPKTVLISKPVPLSVPKPHPAPAIPKIPVEELCLGENNDFTLVDKMLAEMEPPSPKSRAERILKMIQTVNQQIQNAITIIQNVSPYEQDTVSRKEILRLLRMFSDYSKTLEDYFKSINQEKQPSSY